MSRKPRLQRTPELGWGKTKADEVRNRAEELGCIAETDGRAYYRFLRGLNESALNLPEMVSDD
ncbi:MAG: hypothetical protein ACE5HC_10170 [Candidatus Binatia bacterium]